MTNLSRFSSWVPIHTTRQWLLLLEWCLLGVLSFSTYLHLSAMADSIYLTPVPGKSVHTMQGSILSINGDFIEIQNLTGSTDEVDRLEIDAKLDVIELKGQAPVKGLVTQLNSTQVVIETADGTPQTFPRAQVVNVRLGGDQQMGAAESAISSSPSENFTDPTPSNPVASAKTSTAFKISKPIFPNQSFMSNNMPMDGDEGSDGNAVDMRSVSIDRSGMNGSGWQSGTPSARMDTIAADERNPETASPERGKRGKGTPRSIRPILFPPWAPTTSPPYF